MQLASVQRTVMDVITDFLAADPTDQEILDFYLPADLQARAHYLLEQNGEDLLTEAEQEEMTRFMQVDEMMALLKAKIHLKHKRQS